MRREWFIGAAAAVAAALLVMLYLQGDEAKIEAGRELYAARCASCHGQKLEGQPDWQTRLPNGRMPAPPHDASGHTWHHAGEALIGITKFGLKPYAGEYYESDMPAFDGILSDEEIDAVIVYIKSTWPARQREYQVEITRNAAAK